MDYFSCRVCGKYCDDGQPDVCVCAMCLLSDEPLVDEMLQKSRKSAIMGDRENNTANCVK